MIKMKELITEGFFDWVKRTFSPKAGKEITSSEKITDPKMKEFLVKLQSFEKIKNDWKTTKENFWKTRITGPNLYGPVDDLNKKINKIIEKLKSVDINSPKAKSLSQSLKSLLDEKHKWDVKMNQFKTEVSEYEIQYKKLSDELRDLARPLGIDISVFDLYGPNS